MKWWDQMPWSRFSECCFKPIFSLSSFTFIKRLFTSSSLSAIRVVSSAYLRLLIFLSAILILACASSSPAFLMMYSVCKYVNAPPNLETSSLLRQHVNYNAQRWTLYPWYLIKAFAYSRYLRNICECLYWVQDNQHSFLCPPCHCTSTTTTPIFRVPTMLQMCPNLLLILYQ